MVEVNSTGESKGVMQKAKPGDTFLFDNIKCTCPGDPAPRDLGSMAFRNKIIV